MKTRLLITIMISVLVAIAMPFVLYNTTLFHFESSMTGQEFHERFDDYAIVKHFKSTYPDHFAGRGKSPGMISPAWGYGSVNQSTIAELRVEEIFGKYEFTYTCGRISENMFPDVMIRNPSIEDIDNNRCW